MGGSKAIPQWFLNLQAAGKGHIQIGRREHDVDAHFTSDAKHVKCGRRSRRAYRTSPSGRREPDVGSLSLS